MSRWNWLAGAAVALGLVIALGVFGWASQAPAQAGGMGGNFHVVAGGADKAFVLYDAGSGQSWVMRLDGVDKRYAWIQIKRLDTDAEVQNWNMIQKARE
jgi:hypothetical protein